MQSTAPTINTPAAHAAAARAANARATAATAAAAATAAVRVAVACAAADGAIDVDAENAATAAIRVAVACATTAGAATADAAATAGAATDAAEESVLSPPAAAGSAEPGSAAMPPADTRSTAAAVEPVAATAAAEEAVPPPPATASEVEAHAAHVAAPRCSPATERKLAAALRDQGSTPFKFTRDSSINKIIADEIGLTSAQAAGEEAITPVQVRNFTAFFYNLPTNSKLRTSLGKTSTLLKWLHEARRTLKSEETKALLPGQFALPRPTENHSSVVERFEDVLEKIGASVEWHGSAVCGPEHVERFAMLRHNNFEFQRLLHLSNSGNKQPAYLQVLANQADVLAKAAVPPAGHFLLPAPRWGLRVSFPKLLQHLGVAVEPHGGAFCAVEHVEKFKVLMHSTYRLERNSPPFIKVLHEKVKVAELDKVHGRARSIKLEEDGDEMSVPTPAASAADDDDDDNGGMQGSAGKRHRTEAAATRRGS